MSSGGGDEDGVSDGDQSTCKSTEAAECVRVLNPQRRSDGCKRSISAGGCGGGWSNECIKWMKPWMDGWMV